MKLIFLITILAITTHASPAGFNKWLPAGPIDIDKYIPRHLTLPSSPNDNPLKPKINLKGGLSFVPRNDFITYDNCGVENHNTERIVGGSETGKHQFPWIVALFIDRKWFCGGSLISDEWVMTAAHCADGATSVEILAGAHNVSLKSEPGRIKITSTDLHVHPKWNPNRIQNDIALIKLPEKVTFTDNIRPACLPTQNDVDNDFTGEKTLAIGWGKPSDSAPSISPVLRMVDGLQVMTNKKCDDVYGIVTDNIMCVDTTGGHSTCNGDSGGPLNYEMAENKYKQLGVVSFGHVAGCEVGYPAAFTRVNKYLDYISSVTGISVSL